MRKFIRSHQWVTSPDSQGVSLFGITQFSKDYFLRFQRIDNQQYFKTNYGLKFRDRIETFIDNAKKR